MRQFACYVKRKKKEREREREKIYITNLSSAEFAQFVLWTIFFILFNENRVLNSMQIDSRRKCTLNVKLCSLEESKKLSPICRLQKYTHSKNSKDDDTEVFLSYVAFAELFPTAELLYLPTSSCQQLGVFHSWLHELHGRSEVKEEKR